MGTVGRRFARLGSGIGSHGTRSLPFANTPANRSRANCAIGIVRLSVALKHTGIASRAVGESDGLGRHEVRIGRHNIGVEVDHPLAGDAGIGSSHAVRGVAGRATESVGQMIDVAAPAG